MGGFQHHVLKVQTFGRPYIFYLPLKPENSSSLHGVETHKNHHSNNNTENLQTCVIKWSVSNNKLYAMIKLHWVLNKSLFFYRRIVSGTWKLLEISANSYRLQESRVPG
jgi:hypothetical protein